MARADVVFDASEDLKRATERAVEVAEIRRDTIGSAVAWICMTVLFSSLLSQVRGCYEEKRRYDIIQERMRGAQAAGAKIRGLPFDETTQSD